MSSSPSPPSASPTSSSSSSSILSTPLPTCTRIPLLFGITVSTALLLHNFRMFKVAKIPGSKMIDRPVGGFLLVSGGSYYVCRKEEKAKRERLKIMMENQGIKEDSVPGLGIGK